MDGWQATTLLRFANTLGRFCRYDWSDTVPLEAAILALEQRADLKGTVRSCSVVASLQVEVQEPESKEPTKPATLAEVNREIFYRELRYQVGATDLPLVAGTTPSVRLAVLDTHPTDEWPTKSTPQGLVHGSRHGFDLAQIAHNLTCSDPACGPAACATTIATQLALPRTSADPDAPVPSPDQATGGFFGSPRDLAVAIEREVAASKDPSHLILNLSIGWDSEELHKKWGAEAKGINAEELAVYAALVYARAKGALPIAAAGNRLAGARAGNGALLPAGWYTGAPKTSPEQTAALEPLLWAIGGHDRHGRPLASARALSTPPLVAYGDHAVVPIAGGGWTEPLTGTSVSAIVASSIAAAVWNARPELTADQVMGLLERSARDLGRPAELALVVPPPSVKRLDFATALSRAWSRQSFFTAQAKLAPPTLTCDQPTDILCGTEVLTVCSSAAATPSATLCKSGSYPPVIAAAWTKPQPEEGNCPSCSLGSGRPPGLRLMTGQNGGDDWPPPGLGSQLDLEVPASASACLTDLILEVEIAGEGKPRKFWIVPPEGTDLCPGNSLRVQDLPISNEPLSAVLHSTITVGGEHYSLRTPIFVGWQ